MMTETPSYILSQCLEYNENIQVDKASVNFFSVFKENNFFWQLFSESGSIKKWHKFKRIQF